MSNDDITTVELPNTQLTHSFSVKLTKARELLHSRSFGKKVFIIVVLAHLLGYWFWGVIVYWYDVNFSSASSAWIGADYYFGWYMADLFLKNPSILYTASFFTSGPNINSPELVLYTVVWYVISHQWIGLSYYQVFNYYTFSMFLWNFGSCFLIYKLINTEKVKSLLGKTFLTNPFILMSIFMGTSLLFIDYFIGEHDAIASFFVLLGLYYFTIEKEQYCFLAWGFAVVFRPQVFVIMLVLILHGPIKRFIINCAFFVISQVPNIIMFLIWPFYIPQFIGNVFLVANSAFVPRTPANLAEFLFLYYLVPVGISELIICCCILPLTLYVLFECKKQMNFIDKMMVLILLLVNLLPYYWLSHIIDTLGIYLIWIATKNKELKGNIRYLKVMLAFPMLSGLLWLVFPFISFIFIIALFWMNLLIMIPKKVAQQSHTQ